MQGRRGRWFCLRGSTRTGTTSAQCMAPIFLGSEKPRASSRASAAPTGMGAGRTRTMPCPEAVLLNVAALYISLWLG